MKNTYYNKGVTLGHLKNVHASLVHARKLAAVNKSYPCYELIGAAINELEKAIEVLLAKE